MTNGSGHISTEFEQVILCKEMGWTYYELMEQPAWFVEVLRLKINMDAEKQNKDSKKK